MKKLAVIFPGIGYHVDKPLLYYARKLATEVGYEDQIAISYTCTQKKIRGDKEKMRKAFEELYAQTEDALKDIKWDEYEDILFISKSIGTVIAMTYANKENISNVRQILYTPLEATFENIAGNCQAYVYESARIAPMTKTADACESMITVPMTHESARTTPMTQPEEVALAKTDAIAFIGTADPWSSVPEVIRLAKSNNIPIHVYDDANHSLETDDTIENLHIIRDVMKKTKSFII